MTGYASIQSSTDQLELSVSIKAVNGRFLDVRTHLPREYTPLENEIRKKIGGTLKRGTVDIYINRRLRETARQSRVYVNSGMAKEWLKAYKGLAKDLKLDSHKLSVEKIAELPQVTRAEEKYDLVKGEKSHLFAEVEKALIACDKERQREGRALKKHLTTLLSELKKSITAIGRLRKKANSVFQEKLEAKLSKAIKGYDLDPQRVAQEVVILVDKTDISEEIVRLKEHIISCENLLTAKNQKGKKLDFYTQELLREVNTIGSKSSHSEITANVVEAKNTVERFREQVQNVE